MADAEGALGFNFCEGLETFDASLPPRKRLLAGLKLKRQQQQQEKNSTNNNANTDGMIMSCSSSSSHSSSSSSTISSTVVNSPPKNPNFEFLEKSIAAAEAAAVAARTARKIAFEKAEAAVKAAAAAKEALELAAQAAREEAEEDRAEAGPEPSSAGKSKHPKKHVPIRVFYSGEGSRTDEEKVSNNCNNNNGKGFRTDDTMVSNNGNTNGKAQSWSSVRHEVSRVSVRGPKLKNLSVDSANPSSIDDEELARQLHRAINSSPRISRRAANQIQESNSVFASSPGPSPLSKCDRSRQQHVLAESKRCSYRKAVVSSMDNDESLVSEPKYDEKPSSDDNSLLGMHTVEEEGSCSLRCNGVSGEPLYLDSKNAVKVKKLGFKRKRLDSNCSFIEEHIRDSFKLSTCQDNGVHQKNFADRGATDDPVQIDDGGQKPLLVKRLKIKHGSERRTRSISEDFPLENDPSVGPSSSSALPCGSLPPRNSFLSYRQVKRPL